MTRDSLVKTGRSRAGGLLLLSFVVGCGAERPDTDGVEGGDAGQAAEANRSGSGGESGNPAFENLGGTAQAYATRVESFTPGTGAGFNQTKLPGIVLGPPKGLGNGRGSLDVVSLGVGGEIVLGFGGQGIIDGAGPDLIVFENAFWPGGDASQVFAELGEVSVSEDGKTWRTFACDVTGDGLGHFPGCAGATPTLVYDAQTLAPLDWNQSGGDAFDLGDLNITSARYVKVRDLATLPPAGSSSGFDLDAVGAIHTR